MSEPVLTLRGVHKFFGGLRVLNGIDLEVFEEERHAIIGPNGAGKSTLFNIISGGLKPTRGRILYRGQDLAGLRPHQIARLGLARSFQIINIFPNLSVFDNVRGAVVSQRGLRWDCWSRLEAVQDVMQETERVMAGLGLGLRRDMPASGLSYGEQRQLEIALTVALQPRLVLLDEPCAGLNADDTRRAVALIRRITTGRTLVLVEHDMEVVFGLADRISVIYYGEVLATGTPEEIRANIRVQQAYLGRRASMER